MPVLPETAYARMLAETGPDVPGRERRHRDHLDAVLRLPHAAAALRHAAGDLWDAATAPGALDDPRTALALDRYVNRMSTRPTPFGLTAAVVGVPVAAPGEEGGLRLAGPPSPRLRPDARAPGPDPAAPDGWDDRTPLTAAALAHVTGGHLWLEPVLGGRARWTPASAPARAVLEAAVRPVPAGELAGMLAGRFGGQPAAARALIGALVRRGFLRPPARPLSPPPLPAAEETPAGPDYAGLLAASAAAGRPGRPAQVDAIARIRPGGRLPAEVARLAERAAGLLVLIGRGGRYPRDLAHAAAAFTAHYGDGAWVPAPEAVHTLAALRALGSPPPGDDPRDAVLAGVVAEALARRSPARELDDALVTRLAAPADADRPPLPAAEICLRPARTAAGGWSAVLTGPVAVPAGTVHGRFTDLLDPGTRRALRDAARAEEAADPGRVFAELAHRPPGAAANVVAREVWRPYHLPVDVAPELPPEQTLTLGDVLVGAPGGRFALRSARLGRPLHLTQRSSVDLALAPPVCRFLLDASANQYRHAAPFDWGRAAAGPFTPRLTRGPLVVAPARWRLEEVWPDGEFAGALARWRRTWMVPHHVHLAGDSGALLLDLRSAVSHAHLRRALAAAGGAGVVLTEALPAPGGGLVTGADGAGYTAEAVVPVVLETPPEPPAPQPPPAARTAGHRAHLPGGEWTALHLAVPAAAQDAFLTGPLTALTRLLEERFGLREVFFLRYADPGDEIRVRLRTGVPAPDGLRDAVAGWLDSAGRHVPLAGAAAHTYRPETDRYGGPELIGRAQQLFAHDSRWTAGLLTAWPRTARATGLPRTALAAVTLERLARPLLPERAARRALAAALTGTRDGAAAYRAHAAALWRLHTASGPDDPVGTPGAAWAAAAAGFGAALAQLPAGRRDRSAGSLLHLHANRLGLTRAQEAEAFGMWRRLLDREEAAARPPRPGPPAPRTPRSPAPVPPPPGGPSAPARRETP